MYYQVFYRRKLGSKLCQVSCDTFDEINELVEHLGKPKYVQVDTYDQDGFVATSKHLYLFARDQYKKYWRTPNPRIPYKN